MASKMIGIEIGSDTIKMVVVKGDQIQKMAVERLPDHLVQEGRVTAPIMMQRFIKNMMKTHRIRGSQCALVLPPQVVISAHITLPVMSESELKLNLPYEFRDFVGKEGDEFDYDYIVKRIHDNVMELYAAAVRRKLVEDYWTILKKAGLTLKTAMPAELAWMNLLSKTKDAPKKLAIVDIGHETTRINIFRKGVFVMGKTVEVAGQLFDETIAEIQDLDPHAARNRKEGNIDRVQSEEFMHQPYGMVAMEVMKTLDFFNYSLAEGKKPLKEIYFCGGSSNIEILRTAVVKATGMNPHRIYRLVNMKEENIDLAMRCALAAGAAMQEVK